MLTFLCGTAETEKINEIYRMAEKDAVAGKTVFLLVPEQHSMNSETELLSILGMSSQNKITVLTFSKLCNLIFSKMGPLRTKYIDKAGKHIMTRRALQLAENDLHFFKRNLNQHGFTTLVRSAVSEFKRYGISPSTLADASTATTDENLSSKLADLAVIYKKFNQLIDENHANTEDNLSLVVPLIAKATFLHSCSFYLNFFRSFTPTEYAVLTELMKYSNLCVALSADRTDGHSDVFASQLNTFRKLSAIAESCGTEIESPRIFNAEKNSCKPSDLTHLKNNFPSYSPENFPDKPEHIHILRPDNFHAEVTACAQLIRKLIREEGYTFNDILILTGNIENYELLIPQIFEEYEISFFLDQKIPLTENPFMRMIISVLEILAYGFSYERIMRFVRSGYAPVSAQDADIFENYILASDITHAQWKTRDPWTYNPEPRIFDISTINSTKEHILHPILDLADMFSGRKTAATICDNLYKWLEKFQIPKKVAQKIQSFKNNSDTEKAEQLRLVWNSFVSVTSQLGEYLNDEYTTFGEFFELFTAACGELSVGMVPPTHDKVLISSVDMFRSTGCRAAIVLGAVDGLFPRDCCNEGLISDAERLILEKAGITLAPDLYTRQAEEEYLVYSVLTTPREQLYIFSPLSDRDGKGLKASEIILTLKDIFPELLDETPDNDADLALAESRESAFHRLSMKLFENGWNEHLLPPVWQTICRILKADPSYGQQLEKLRIMHASSTETQELSAETARKLYGLPLTLSVSKLEKYNGCAFSFFMRYGLVAQERLLGGLNSADTGNILHSVLCDYFKAKAEIDADYSAIDREQCRQEISALVDNLSEETNANLFATSHYYKYMMMRMKSIATATAWKLIKFYSRSSFRPSGFEISFGKHGEYPPYELDTAEGKVYLKGFIDRVDRAEIDGTPYVSITDYKSSERKLDIALAEAGIHFQPLIYANALTKNSTDTQVAAMFYLQMSDPLISCKNIPTEDEWEKAVNDNIAAHGLIADIPGIACGIDSAHGDKNAVHYIRCDKKSLIAEEQFKKMLTDADTKAAETADNILSGKIDINPSFISGFDPCAYCPYGAVCQNNH